MAFPASTGVLSKILGDTCAQALNMKQYAANIRDDAAAGDIPARQVIGIDGDLHRYRQVFAEAGAKPGILEVAREEFNDPALDITVEWNAMMAAIDDVRAWVRANFPTANQGGTPYLAAQAWGANGPVDRLFTPAQTAGLRAQLDALIATVA